MSGPQLIDVEKKFLYVSTEPGVVSGVLMFFLFDFWLGKTISSNLNSVICWGQGIVLLEGNMFCKWIITVGGTWLKLILVSVLLFKPTKKMCLREWRATTVRLLKSTLVLFCFKKTGQLSIDMDVSKNRGTPKWMVKIVENPIKMDDLGEHPLFSETPRCLL